MQENPQNEVQKSLRIAASLVTWYWLVMMLTDKNGFGSGRFPIDYPILGCYILTGLLLIKLPKAAALLALGSGLSFCIMIYFIPVGLPLIFIGLLTAFSIPSRAKKLR